MNPATAPVRVTYTATCSFCDRAMAMDFADPDAPKPDHVRCLHCNAYCRIVETHRYTSTQDIAEPV